MVNPLATVAPLQAEPLLGMSLSILLFLADAGLIVGEVLAPGTHAFVLGVALLTAGLVEAAHPCEPRNPRATHRRVRRLSRQRSRSADIESSISLRRAAARRALGRADGQDGARHGARHADQRRGQTRRGRLQPLLRARGSGDPSRRERRSSSSTPAVGTSEVEAVESGADARRRARRDRNRAKSASTDRESERA